MEKLQVRLTQDEVTALISVLRNAAEQLERPSLREAAHRFAVRLEYRRLRYWHPVMADSPPAQQAPPQRPVSFWNGNATGGNL